MNVKEKNCNHYGKKFLWNTRNRQKCYWEKQQAEEKFKELEEKLNLLKPPQSPLVPLILGGIVLVVVIGIGFLILIYRKKK